MESQVKNDLNKNVKPLTTKDILSPSTKFVNPIVKSLSGKVYEDGGFKFVYGG
ncbi:MAG: hypothetical protein PG980_000807 [Wolbachia endosymbiont of Ctenocephalides felis wCfeJ]|nr:MAG: hypothetical protein PG980_000807 [Wolbachia endosymbiont of Ctenocephalides felis wCfeJ]